MSVQSYTNQNTKIYSFGNCRYKSDLVVGFGTAGRATDGDMVKGTVMCRNGDGYLVPLTELDQTDGTSRPVGILHCKLSQAELEAAATNETVECLLLFEAEAYNEEEVVFDGASSTLTLDDSIQIVLTDENIEMGTIRDELARCGIFFQSEEAVADYEVAEE